MILNSTRLCLTACKYLADKYYQRQIIPAVEIADKYEINQRALMPALNRLVKAKILHSRVGGRNSGFIFAKDPKEISVLDIIVALQGEAVFKCCTSGIMKFECEMSDPARCPVAKIYSDAIAETNRKLGELSIFQFKEIEEKERAAMKLNQINTKK